MSSGRMLDTVEVQGSDEQCGEQYGEVFGPGIMCFYAQEVKKHERFLLYAAQCWQYIQDHARNSAGFIRGMSKSSGMSPESLVLLLLHEELFQITRQGTPHCTGFAAKMDDGTRRGVVVGENWDWPPGAYPWPGMLRTCARGSPKILSYHYPGLWTALGMNEHGLTLMWTGGYNVSFVPLMGIPTYVLIAEILRHKKIDEVIDYVERINRAGAFVFLLGDAFGDYCVLEGTPGGVLVERSIEPLSRANNFLLHPTDPRELSESQGSGFYKGSLARQHVMQQHLTGGMISVDRCKQVLHSPSPIYDAGFDVMTVDCFVASCFERILWTCRGGKTPGPWQAISV